MAAATSQTLDHRNNLDAIRLLAAWAVLYGHSYIFLGLPEPHFLSWIPLGPLGVLVFFTISGYLVSQSFARDPNLYRFFVRRLLRIIPGLAVCIVLSAFILGPLLTTLPLDQYFENPHTIGYLRNIGLFIIYYLPGVFEHNRVPVAVNGSLWSLPIEFFMYILLALVAVLQANRWVFLALAILSAAISFFWAQQRVDLLVVYASDVRQVFLCGTYFWIGAVFHRFDLAARLRPSHAFMALVIMLGFEPWSYMLPHLSWLLLPVVVFGFGFSRNELLVRMTSSGDYSYGIYIFAFPVQQAWVERFPDMPIGLYLFVCTATTLPLAIASWHLVEKRALRLKPYRRQKHPTHPQVRAAAANFSPSIKQSES